MVCSAAGVAKRALVVVLNSLAAIYGFKVTVDRDLANQDVVTAIRKAQLKTHPDHGGETEHQQQLNAAKAAWESARKKAPKNSGAEAKTKAKAGQAALGDNSSPALRISSEYVLLTYQGVRGGVPQKVKHFYCYCSAHRS